MDNNVYLLTCKATGQQVLIDAADDLAAIQNLLNLAKQDGPNARLTTIITSHCHLDHLRALADLAKTSAARLYAGREDIPAIENATGLGGIEPIDHGDCLQVGQLNLMIIGLRGHTPGGIGVAYSEPGSPTFVFSGDSLFPGGVGATDRDPQRFDLLLSDVANRLFAAFPDDTVVLPGHGRSTTISAEQPQLEVWAARGW